MLVILLQSELTEGVRVLTDDKNTPRVTTACHIATERRCVVLPKRILSCKALLLFHTCWRKEKNVWQSFHVLPRMCPQNQPLLPRSRLKKSMQTTTPHILCFLWRLLQKYLHSAFGILLQYRFTDLDLIIIRFTKKSNEMCPRLYNWAFSSGIAVRVA